MKISVKALDIMATPVGSCPCGGEIMVSTEPTGVGHAVPPCSKYLELEPDEFLAYVRKSREV